MTSNPSVFRLVPAIVLLMVAAIAFAALAVNVAANARISAEEAQALIRSLWFASGAVQPYSAADAASGAPLYPLLLGLWQRIAGADPFLARYLSVALAAIDAALLFIICRRLTANTLVAAAAVAILLVTPAAAYFYATASSVAWQALLHLLAILIIVQSLGRPRLWASVALAVIVIAMLATDRNAIVQILFLVPLYVLAIGRGRVLHGALLILIPAAAIVAAALVLGDRVLDGLGWRQLAMPLLQSAGIAPSSGALIAMNTAPATGLQTPPNAILTRVIDSLALPYGAALIGGIALFLVVGRGLRALWAIPLYLIWLAVWRIAGAWLGQDGSLIELGAIDLTAAAFGSAVTLAMVRKSARDNGLTGSVVVIGGALAIVAANTFAPALATSADRQFFPAPMLKFPGSGTEQADLRKLEEFIGRVSPAGETILILHQAPIAPLAATLAGRRIPPQSAVPIAQSYRAPRAGLAAGAREATLAAIERSGYWTDETLTRWIDREYDVILLQDGIRFPGREGTQAALTAAFEPAGEISIAGQRLVLYKRKT